MTSVCRDDDKLLGRILACMNRLGTFQGMLYRSCTPRYATETDLLTGEGSRQFGGRWNPPGIAAVYASLTPECAMAETLAHYHYYGIPIHQAMPRTFVAIQARLQRVLDLTDGMIRQRIQVSEERMLKEDWHKQCAQGGALTQQIGNACHAAGCEAMLVRSSTAPQGLNLVIFPEILSPGSRLEILHKEDLR